MPRSQTLQRSLQEVMQSAQRLKDLSFTEFSVEPLLNLAALMALRTQLGQPRPSLVGFIGCTGTGKSTLFNSLAAAHLSGIGWKSHNTRGPVLLSDRRFCERLDDVEKDLGRLLFPALERKYMDLNRDDNTLGLPSALHWIASDQHALPKVVLLDLPDINTTRSREDRLVALEVMPWLDRVVFVLDEEYLYHRDYEEPARQTIARQQSRVCILNNRGKDRIVLEHRDMQETKRVFGVDEIHVLPIIREGTRFTRESEFLHLKTILESPVYAPIKPLQREFKPRVEKLLNENRLRDQQLRALEQDLDAYTREQLQLNQTIPFQEILNDDALNMLQHLGLKRFSGTNVLHFLRKLSTMQDIGRQFQMAFGNRQDQAIQTVLHLDQEKLKDVVSRRLHDLEEKTWNRIRNYPQANALIEKAPEFKKISFTLDRNTEKELQEIVETFENECHEMLQTDTLSGSVINDPLVALGVLAALAADWFTLPGTGSWLIAPTLFRFLPLGKFDSAKRRFQHQVYELIQKQVNQGLTPLTLAQKRLVIPEQDPLLTAMKRIADDTQD